MVEHGVLDIMYLNKNNSSSAASSPDKEKKNFDNFKISFTDDYPKKNAEILSGQYGINLLLVGLSLMLALFYRVGAVLPQHLLSLLISLMLLQITWMLWYIVRKDRQTCFVSEKDSDAGTSWLRAVEEILQRSHKECEASWQVSPGQFQSPRLRWVT
ncbi:UNVERIFIED_CONTAM: hypothetical protein FKN15_055301 [Acipenser sinensis]